ncbi:MULTISPECIES: hypothetical protein [unclassified Sporosarcina]|uniref:hypothetical protein n=1 Tax=unclassified Sporosarcina TaxID=2647733 RepID=UPI001A92D957|nr:MULTISPECIES: hypothetical protein [unclassified Sporosarcina]MBO0589263.1 hypothetical protein [Sporosarcina sp. E16_8]MBO0601970.1 hypothetical protein [Sporosarcina sp. E16_3]
MAIRLRTKKLLWAGALGASVTLVLAAVGGYLLYTKNQASELALAEQYRSELKVLNETVVQNEEGYALKEDVDRGQLITEDLLEKVTLSAAAKSEDGLELIEIKTIDYFSRTDLKANTVLVESMVYEEEALGNDIRETEYAFIDLPTKLKNEDYVDVRIQFPNGDDYILLSKKKVKDTAGLTLWMNMDEGEILSMSSAIVDAFIEEAKIYALPYVDGPMQVASEMTYPVKSNVLQLIKETPNIVNIAKLNLEKQNRTRLESGLNEMNSELRQKLRQGQAETEAQRQQDDKEREINALNQFDQPTENDLIGDPFKEGVDAK